MRHADLTGAPQPFTREHLTPEPLDLAEITFWEYSARTLARIQGRAAAQAEQREHAPLFPLPATASTGERGSDGRLAGLPFVHAMPECVRLHRARHEGARAAPKLL